MINLSEQLLSSPDVPIWVKLRYITDPDWYLAGSVADFSDECRKIRVPWWKRCGDIFGPYYCVSIYNVRLTRVENAALHWYAMEDDTGMKVVGWFSKNNALSGPTPPEEILEPGEDSIFAYRVSFLYCIRTDFPIVCGVEREPPSPIQPEKSEAQEDDFNGTGLVLEPA